MIKCPECGFENEDVFKFCLNCGASLSKVEAAEPEVEKIEPEVPEEDDLRETTPLDDVSEEREVQEKVETFEEPPHEEGEVLEAVKEEETGKKHKKVCPNCGFILAERDIFCPECGTKYKEEKSFKKTTPQVLSKETSEIVGKLVIINPDGTKGKNFPIYTTHTFIGREKGDIILEDDLFLSPVHCKLVFEDSSLFIEDLDSFNGVFIRIKDKVYLDHGDIFRMGQELLMFEYPPVPDTSSEPRVLASTTPPIYFIISQLLSPTKYGRRFVIHKEKCVLGREYGDITFPQDGYVSRRHAEIGRENGSFYLLDLGSSNGTYLKIKERKALSNGDMILVGKHLFLVELD